MSLNIFKEAEDEYDSFVEQEFKKLELNFQKLKENDQKKGIYAPKRAKSVSIKFPKRTFFGK